MTTTFILFAIGWVSVAILVLTLLLDGLFDFFDFDFFDGSIGPTAIFGFLGVFGLTGGMLNQSTEWGLFGVLSVAVVAGLIFGFLISRIFVFLQNSSSGQVSEKSIVGETAFVVLSVPAKGYGKVKVYNSGHTIEMAAISKTGDIPMGSSVVITELVGSNAVMVEVPAVQETEQESKTE